MTTDSHLFADGLTADTCTKDTLEVTLKAIVSIVADATVKLKALVGTGCMVDISVCAQLIADILLVCAQYLFCVIYANHRLCRQFVAHFRSFFQSSLMSKCFSASSLMLRLAIAFVLSSALSLRSSMASSLLWSLLSFPSPVFSSNSVSTLSANFLLSADLYATSLVTKRRMSCSCFLNGIYGFRMILKIFRSV